MRYLGLDLGSRTLGISISDVTHTIASTLKTVRFEDSDYDSLIPIIKEIIDEFKISKIVLGLPKNMNDTIGDRGNICLEFKNCSSNCFEFNITFCKSVLIFLYLYFNVKHKSLKVFISIVLSSILSETKFLSPSQYVT